MVFQWLANRLFGPKRAEISEIWGILNVHERRLKTIEQAGYAIGGKERRQEQDEETQALLAEAALMLKDGKDIKEVLSVLLTKNPGAALRLARQYGIKI